jgi:L-ascorbate metabolism protein UlaG (beta-lactamase superfamily)
LLLIAALVVLAMAWTAIGKRPTGERLQRMHASPNWGGSTFVNPEPMWNNFLGMMTEGFSASDHTAPSEPLVFDATPPDRFDTEPESGLRVTWLGHSTVLIEIDGLVVLTDPVWGERTAPLNWLGPERWYAPLIALDELPPVDVVLISHDHYDHLDYPTMAAIADWDATFIAPLGVGAHLEYWGVPSDNVVELDWWQTLQFGDVTLHSVPSRHASGRQILDQNRTLWCGYALVGSNNRALFSGDTGLFSAMSEIGERLGPFDVTMIEVGAYAQAWPDWHLGPEQALDAHQRMQGDVFLPIHWGLFDLAYHSWTEPIERVMIEAERLGVRVATPRPGESFEPAAVALPERWWPEIEWRTAAEYPIEARGLAE